ncbi:protein EMSY-LIKE 1-like isoform X1 [Cucurbita maxima]|uniref:Protein EMSY-LIKE 1-like isoform X1 n=2 Tax=Cucurbita maxima TaxID=3661 RepID=A0A6J1J6F5_CUCMA|nr:protein EMSY-LIKE 1-like isoform X1 [Cucurbita maxima]XP_022982969.1 protein EMSY-LIKE 1-like isoform X1 [Cucurbita maxima]
MDYEACDSSGTDDDHPQSHHNRVSRGGHISGRRTSVLSSFPYSRVHDMETRIHDLEKEAYSSVLRALKAQGDAITWDKESLLTELRKELRVSDDEHRELIASVNSDDIIREIREWRQAGGHQTMSCSSSLPVHDVVPSPTVLASRKKQKTSKLYSSSVPAGRRQLNNRSSSGALLANESAEAPTYDETFIGRKVWTRWPDDNNFYEAVIRNYDPVKACLSRKKLLQAFFNHFGNNIFLCLFLQDKHVLVYDANTSRETWECVDIKEIPPEDIQWDWEDLRMTHRGGHSGRLFRRTQSSGGFAPGAGRGRGRSMSQSRKEISPSQNRVGKKAVDDIELLNTEVLVKEVEKVFNSSNPDPVELEKAKKVLKDQELALVDAISRLAYTSDGESEREAAKRA